MFTIRITHNLDKLVDDLKAMEAELRSFIRFWRGYVLPYLLQEVDEVFDDQPWDPLHPWYAWQKAQDFPGQPILRRTDLLYHSLTQLNAPGSVQEFHDDVLVFGTDVPYAYYHEFGITPPNNWGPLPKRSVFENFDPNYEDQLQGRLETYLDDLVDVFEHG